MSADALMLCFCADAVLMHSCCTDGKQDCQACQALTKHVAVSNAEVYYVPELSLGCKDLETLMKVSGALLIHNTAHARATNIVQDLEYMSFNICR